MRKLILFFLSVALLSCTDNSNEVEKNEETFTISQAETLEFFLAKAMPVEGGFNISQQAQNFSVSEIQHRENGLYYIYAPEDTFTGTEVVKIKRQDSNGATVYSETITTLIINVRE
ncbi:hypothetical protein [Salinimicrobium xinjiangense]|uniref:hypothetical protein n=1 Tax=Salinimicrobium xinjiangense TaxID=438596 RepID=UPI0004252C91|nr:hypothetical protein [Salinimicrobium xinjiangense]